MADRKAPQVAQVEEYNSDESSVRPGTRVQAKRKTTSSRPAPKIVQRRGTTAGDVDHRSRSVDRAQDVITVTHVPVLQAENSRNPDPRSHGQNIRPSAPHRSATVPQPSGDCGDLRCTHQRCQVLRNPERQYTGQQPPVSHYATSTPQYTLPQYQQQAQVQQYSQAAHILTSQPQLRAPSMTSQVRPVSLYGGYPASGYPVPGLYSSSPTQHGPPPSPSAYRNQPTVYYTSAQQPLPYHGVPTASPVSSYPHPSPIVAPPISPVFGTMPPLLQRSYSARQNAPIAASYQLNAAMVHPMQSQPISARQVTSTMPGSYPAAESSGSGSDSDSEYSERARADERHRQKHYERERERKQRKQDREREEDRERERARERKRQDDLDRDHERRSRADSKLMPPPSRRPSMSRHNTTTSYADRSVRGYPRTPRQDMEQEYPSSSDHVDSDRTARAVVDKRRSRANSSYTSTSRRPSIATTSSTRTKATSVSDGSGARKVIIEDSSGRRTAYLSKEAQEDLINRYEQIKLEDHVDRVEAYQRKVTGGVAPELTAENIKKSQHRASGSHISTHSRKSSQHSSKLSRNDGIRIETGGTTLHIYGDTKVEMRPGEDGGPTQLIIGGGPSVGKDRDSAYHSGSKTSKSSRSGVRSDAGRRRNTIRGEDGGQ